MKKLNRKQRAVLIRIVVSAALLAASLLAKHYTVPSLLLFGASYIVIGYDILIEAAVGIKNLQPFDENFLMAAATVGAIALGEYVEAAAVMLLYQIGELFQSYAVGKSRRSISELMDIRPDFANLVGEDGLVRKTDPDEIPVGSIIEVKPGERIPIDGVIIEGSAVLDTAALTGESLPRDVSAGDEAVSGCISTNGLIRIRTTAGFSESTASRILDLVENASSRKSKSEDFIAKFAAVYTPAVCFSALALAVLPPVLRSLSGLAPDWNDWVYRALSFLVISCPCALVISIPLTFFAGLGGAGASGVLIKGSNYMETLSRVKHVVFDKTGTLTKGAFEVSNIKSAGMSGEKLLEYAAYAESVSSHPIALSIVRSYGAQIDRSRLGAVTEHSGRGVLAELDGVAVAAGNARLMESLGIDYDASPCPGTAVYVSVGGKYTGRLEISDTLKDNAPAAIEALKGAGISRISMLTGDSEAAGRFAAERLGIDDTRCGLLPADKVTAVEEYIEKAAEGEKVAFVGDGINDAPVLAVADVGIAMGVLGSDAAIEAADVVLMDDDPRKIVKAVNIAKKCLRIVRENIALALGVKTLCLVFAATGAAGMWLAIFADVGVMVLAVLNAVRALRIKTL